MIAFRFVIVDPLVVVTPIKQAEVLYRRKQFANPMEVEYPFSFVGLLAEIAGLLMS